MKSGARSLANRSASFIKPSGRSINATGFANGVAFTKQFRISLPIDNVGPPIELHTPGDQKLMSHRLNTLTLPRLLLVAIPLMAGASSSAFAQPRPRQSGRPDRFQVTEPNITEPNITEPNVADDDDPEWTPEERRNIRVYEKTNRSVVNIMTRTIVRADFAFRTEVAEGSGSGSVLDRDGHLLTNMHVIDGAREIRVTIHTGAVYDAHLVGQDPLNDIAVLKIDAPARDLIPLPFGDASRLRVGTTHLRHRQSIRA